MSVYVDDMKAAYGHMKMCHMLADTDDELHTMADRIGVARKWHQNTISGSHYDIVLSKRALAIRFGAIPVSLRTMAAMAAIRRETGVLGSPDTAEVIRAADRSGK
jgi:hypothetical protein